MDLIEQVVVLVDSFVEGFPEARDGLVELFATDKMILPLDHAERGHDPFLKD
jgi:hypothetical protein